MIDRRAVIGGGSAGLLMLAGASALRAAAPDEGWVNVRHFGAAGDGRTIDTPAINRAIEHAATRGGGVVHVPAGTYACYSIRLKSRITLDLAPGAVILAAPAPSDGRGGYDLAEPIDSAYADFQDFGHSHWRNSLIWGDGLDDLAITGPGLIWGKALGRGDGKDNWLKDPTGPRTGNKAIALRNCRNVVIRDVRILEGGWFALLATGVDNLTIDNVIADTNRDGFDIDCCRNVRVTNCTVNSPYDDGICFKSSYALGEARATENVTVSNCFVSGNYAIGSVIDGSWRKMPADFAKLIHGRIKFGTESNGGFRNVAVTNCVFEDSRGFAIETVDGAVVEDFAVSNLTMRGIVDAPLFLRIGKRMRGPKGVSIGSMRRILIENVTSSSATILPSVIAGLAERRIEGVRIANVFLQHVGGAPAAMADVTPPEAELGYPEATMFGDLPATGLFVRHAQDFELSHSEIAVVKPDPRPAIALDDVHGADFIDVRVPRGAPAFKLTGVSDFRSALMPGRLDRSISGPETTTF